MKVVLVSHDGAERETDITGLPTSIIVRERTGPMVASVADLENAPPVSVLLDKYGPEGRAWYAKHPEPRAPTRELVYVLSGEKTLARGRYVYVEKCS